MSLQDNVQDLMSMAKHREELEESRRKRIEETERIKTEQQVKDYEKAQSFANKHGSKIMSFLAAGIAAGLAWYGTQIRNEIKAEQRAAEVDKSLEEHTTGLAHTKKDIKKLQEVSVTQTLMIEEVVDHFDETMMKVHPRQLKSQDDLPQRSPEFRNAASSAKNAKTCLELYGRSECNLDISRSASPKNADTKNKEEKSDDAKAQDSK